MTSATAEEWIVTGTKGRIRVHGPAHTPGKITTTRWTLDPRTSAFDEVTAFDTEMKRLSEPPMSTEYMYPGSAGLAFQVHQVQQAIAKGMKECPEMSLDESLLISQVMDDARKQIGVVFAQDLDETKEV